MFLDQLHMSNINNGGQIVLYLLDQIDFISDETISVNGFLCTKCLHVFVLFKNLFKFVC